MMSLHRSRLALAAAGVAGLVAVLTVLPRAPGQDVTEPPAPPVSRNRPIPVIDFQFSWMGMKIQGMHAEGNKPILGKPTAPAADLRYYYLPLMAFIKNGAGELDVSANDQGEVTLPLIMDSDEARQAFRDYLIEKKQASPEVTTAQVMTVSAKEWYLETTPGYEPRVRFGPYFHYQFGLKDQLHTRLSPDDARKFVEDLKAGQVSLNATIAFEGYSNQDDFAVITSEDLLTTEEYKKLTGPGGPGFVGRNQVARIAYEACLKRGVIVTTEYQDADFAALVKNIVDGVAKPDVANKVVADWAAVQKDFNEWGWDPDAFKADLTEAAKRSENKELHDSFAQEIESDTASKGSGGLGLNIFKVVELDLGGSGEGSDKEKSKVCRDVLDKWGIQTDWGGKKYVPKSIDVYTLNTGSFRRTDSFAVGMRRKTVGEGVLTVSIDGNNNVLHAKATPAYEEKLAKLLGQVADLEKISISKTRVDIRGSKMCMAPRLDPQGYYEFPVFLNFAAAAAAPTLLDQPYQEDGRERVFGQEIVAVFLIPQRLHAEAI